MEYKLLFYAYTKSTIIVHSGFTDISVKIITSHLLLNDIQEFMIQIQWAGF